MKLASYTTDNYKLDIAKNINEYESEPNKLPTKKALNSLKVKDSVKLIIKIKNTEPEKISNELLWVLITNRHKDILEGELIRDPIDNSYLEYGDTIFFKEQHVVDFYKYKDARKITFISVAIMLFSIFGLFFVGSYFDLFGNKIEFSQSPSQYLFFVMPILAVFGMAYLMSFSKKIALISSLVITCIYLLLYLMGKISRGEL